MYFKSLVLVGQAKYINAFYSDDGWEWQKDSWELKYFILLIYLLYSHMVD